MLLQQVGMLSEVTTDEDDERRKVEKNRLRLVPNLSHNASIAKEKPPGARQEAEVIWTLRLQPDYNTLRNDFGAR